MSHRTLVLQIRARNQRYARLVAVDGGASTATSTSFETVRTKVHDAFSVGGKLEDGAEGYALAYVDKDYGDEVAIASEEEWQAYMMLVVGESGEPAPAVVRRFDWVPLKELGVGDRKNAISAPSSSRQTAPTIRYQNPYSALSAKNKMDEQAPKQSQLSTPAQEPPAPPQYAFQSIEPQKVGDREERLRKENEMRRNFEQQMAQVHNGRQEQTQDEKVPQATTGNDEARDEEPKEMTAFERMMARSRAHGEALNHTFGTLQARRAGNAPTPRQEEVQQQTAPVDESASHTISHDSAPQPREGSKGSDDKVDRQNEYLADRWLERLQQMGHGGQSSPYARLRGDKARQESQEGQASLQDPTTSTHASLRFEQPTSSEVEGYQIISPADRPQQQPSAIPMMVPRVPSYPDVVDTAAGPQTANIETQVGQQQQPQWQPFPTVSRPPSRQDGSRPSSTFRSRASSSGVPFLGNQQGGRSGSRLSLRATSGAVVRTNAAHVAANEPSSSVVPVSSAASATDEGVLGGTETPNRFGSFGRRYKGKSSALSSSRSRKLSVRSLTEALLHKPSPPSASSLAFSSEEASSSAAASTSEQRPRMHARHLSWKGLARDVGAMKNSLLSSKEPINARDHDSSSTVAPNSHLQGADTATERQGLEVGEQGSHVDIEPDTAQASQPMERRGDNAADNSRPSLLRASQSAPLSATAVNLTPAGGITLHISSVGRFPAVHRNSLSGDALGNAPVPKDLFDLMLPRELRVACMRALVRLHEEEHDTLVETRQWRGNRARQARHYGREAAMRELVRLSRVSKTWQSLLFDGQLWSEVDASLVAGMSNGTLLRIVKNSGAFVKHLSLSGRAELEAKTIAALGTQQRSSPSSPSSHRPARDVVIATGRKRATRKLSLLNEKEQLSLLGLATSLSSLTTINLQGCKTLTSRALHHLLVRTPNLGQALLADVPAVTNDSLVLLGVTVPKLTKLDISRCTNATASGLMNFLLAAQQRTYLEKEQEHHHEYGVEHHQLRLSELHCSGLLGVDETLLATMGQALPELRSLDLSYCLGLRDSAIEAFVAHSGPVKNSSLKGKSVTNGQRYHHRETLLEGSYVSLTPRQAGGNIASDDIHYRRLFPQLGHLNLSSCRHLTDRACTLLAHAVPQLEILEMANIGAGIKDAGLVRLFETTPKIRMVDLEGATDITALTMEAITPEAAYVESLGLDPEGLGDGSNATGGTGAGVVAVGGLGLRSAARRSLRRALAIEHQPDTSASATTGRRSYRQSSPPPGSQLTHLVLSHANLVDAASLLQLIRRCPKLIHLEADDTRANEAVAREFVMLARERHKRGSYISLVDCRGLTLAVNRELNSCAAIRPRQGMRGHRWAKDLAISYEDPDVDPFAANASTDDAGASQQEGTSGSAPSPSTSRHRGGNQELALQSLSTYGECEPDMVVFKSFWGWEAVDVRLKARKKFEAKRSMTSSQSRSASISAVLGLGLGIGIVTGTREAGNYDEENGGDGQQQQQQQGQQQRWGRLSTNLLTPGDEADDARGCLIM